MKKLIVIFIFMLVVNAFGLESNMEHQSKRLNVLILCIDDLRTELNCFGKPFIKSPNIDSLAENGLKFNRHYVQAPSCGPSRYAMLTGKYGSTSNNNALFFRAKKMKEDPASVPPSMPEWFKTHGYTTVSVGKVSHHPGGMGGNNWDDELIIEMPEAWDKLLMPVGEWEHPRGAMHGLAHGEKREKSGKTDVFQAVEGPDTIYPDGLIVEEGLKQLDMLAGSGKPFFLAVGIIKPHLPFGCPAEYYDIYKDMKLPAIPFYAKPEDTFIWHGSGEFMQYNRWGKNPNIDIEFADEVRRHYASCVSYADAQVGKVMKKLKEVGADKNTIIVLWGDHGWHLGEHHIWGKHTLYEEALHSPLILSYPGMKNTGSETNAIVNTIDIFPTLCELSGLEVPEFADGSSLKPVLESPEIESGYAVSYWGGFQSIRSKNYRLILNKNGDVRLYDHRTKEKETVNLAEKEPSVVQTLTTELKTRLNNVYYSN